jgi:predicted transcriptional regulator of viral defense system
LAAGQAGYFSAAQAHELGYSSRSLVHHVAAAHFERVSRGFYRLVGVPSERYEDVVAAWVKLASRGAVVSHETALALHDLAPSRSHDIHLTVPRAHRPRVSQPGSAVRLHTAVIPLRRDEVANRLGVQLTSPARTIADVTEGGTDPSVVVEATRRALVTGLLTASELLEVVNRRSQRVRRLVERAIAEAGSRA